MRVYSAQQMRAADLAAVKAGVPSQLLMEMAGQKLADYALKHWPKATKILVLCGKGNNGGDAYVAARYLRLAGKNPVLLELAKSEGELSTPDAKVARASYLAEAESYGFESFEHYLAEAELVIDGLLGSGLSRPLATELVEIVDRLNAAKKDVLSIDIPSGINADTPQIIGPFVQATRTLQLAGPKLASVFYQARSAFGHWDVADIGIPAAILEALSSIHLLDDQGVGQCLPRRKPTAHKYSVGTVLLVAGSSRYLGAAEMAGRAALRGGAGLVTLAAESRLPQSWPEIIFERLDWSADPLQQLVSLPHNLSQARVIGPGLDQVVKDVLPELIMQRSSPTVLDAGALTPSEAWFRAVRHQGKCILTPHAGEAARLLGSTALAVELDPLASALQLHELTAAVVVLKGPSTVIASEEGLWLSLKGHPGMATGGTGDVLAGLLASFLFEGHLTLRSCAAVYVHGLAGEQAAQRYGNGLIATDLIEAIPEVIQKLQRNPSHIS